MAASKGWGVGYVDWRGDTGKGLFVDYIGGMWGGGSVRGLQWREK